MRMWTGLVFGLALAACQPDRPAGPQDAAGAPDAIVFGGVIHTGLEATPEAEALSIRDGRIIEVADRAAIEASAGPRTQRIDLGGAHLYPGFIDAHAHLLGIGERELTLNLDAVASLADLVKAVERAAAKTPEGQVVVGRGWIETHWPEKRFPTRDDFDAVSAGRPVILTRADGHALVANSAALKAAGLDRPNPSQPAGGRIELDASGRPTGMLIDNAMGAVASLAAERTGEALEKAYETGAAVYLGRWTGVHNMSVPPAHVATLNRLADAGRLPLRLYNAVDADALVALGGPRASGVFGEAANGRVVTRAIKLYMDGALGSRGALLAAPYADRPDTTGLQLAEEAATQTLMREALAAGLQICLHAIGDRGNTLALDWMARTFAGDPERAADARWRIEHAQILAPADIPRFKQLGVIASMQPSHAIGDLYFAPARLGPERLAGAYAWRSLINAGAVIAGGSDAPVEKGDPLIEFYAAIARKDLKGASGPDWRPEEAVSRIEALRMFTLWPAYAAFQEKDLGTVEPGKLADFTVLSKDILSVPEAEILSARPVMTLVGGDVVWRAD
jgi:predicted amidohydrolase YtcJ